MTPAPLVLIVVGITSLAAVQVGPVVQQRAIGNALAIGSVKHALKGKGVAPVPRLSIPWSPGWLAATPAVSSRPTDFAVPFDDARVNDAVLARAIARVYLVAGAPQEALGALDRADSGEIASWMRGLALWQLGRRDEARSIWRTSGLLGLFSAPFLEAASRAQRAGRWKESAAYAAEAARIDPGDGYAWFLAAESERQLGESDRALTSYRRGAEVAVSAAWYTPVIHARIGTILRDAGQPDEALREFQEAVRLNPGDTWSWLAIGGLRRARGEPREARDAFCRAAYPLPGLAEAHVQLAGLAETQRDLAARKRHLELAVAASSGTNPQQQRATPGGPRVSSTPATPCEGRAG